MIRVLAVDNSNDVLLAYTMVLTPANGYELTTVDDRDKALEILKTKEIDIVIYDIPHGIRYGKLFNPDAIRDLKKLQLEYPDMPIIATSTEPAIAWRPEEFKDLGIRSCLAKTFRMQELANVINEIVGRKK